MVKSEIFDESKMVLGEGILWHPLRESLIWFDIKKRKMFERKANEQNVQHWQLKEAYSAAGWVDENQLIVASNSAVSLFDMRSASHIVLSKLEADNRFTRANKGRADPYGGFWISTMGINAEPNLGAIYRYYDGALRRLFRDLNAPNAICFAPEGGVAYFGDSQNQSLYRVRLDWQGWPESKPEPFVSTAPHIPYGAITDKDGNIWNAQGQNAQLTCYNPEGDILQTIEINGQNLNAIAFGGADFRQIFVMSQSCQTGESGANVEQILSLSDIGVGQAEYAVLID